MSDYSDVTTAPDGIFDDFSHPGVTNDTTFFNLEDWEGDAEDEEWEETVMDVGWLVVLLFAVGLVLAGLLFYFYIRRERMQREERAAKLAANGGMSTPSGSVTSTTISPPPSTVTAAVDPNVRLQEIEDGLIVEAWVGEVITMHPHMEETKEDEDSDGSPYATGSSRSSIPPLKTDNCPICRKPFQPGEMIVHSKTAASCDHSFHKTCMFNWLQYQNRCPVCNAPYLETTTTTTTTTTETLL